MTLSQCESAARTFHSTHTPLSKMFLGSMESKFVMQEHNVDTGAWPLVVSEPEEIEPDPMFMSQPEPGKSGLYSRKKGKYNPPCILHTTIPTPPIQN